MPAASAPQSSDQSDSTKNPSKPKQTPAVAPTTNAPVAAGAPAPASKPTPPTTPSASTPAAAKPASAQQVLPAKSKAMVWVNTDSGIYHKPGTRFYGKTKQGNYMSEADAIKAGYRPAGKN